MTVSYVIQDAIANNGELQFCRMQHGLIEDLFVLGINHNKTSLKDRNKIDWDDQFEREVMSRHQNLKSLVYLNTCNRIEFYGEGDASSLLKTIKNSLPSDFNKSAVSVAKGVDALNHLFKVSAGLDSQLIGDLEVLGQFKKAVGQSKAGNRLSGYFERLANVCVQASKEIRTSTSLSSGITSLSYAAIQILNNLKISNTDSILLIGLGKFGKSIALNLHAYFPDNSLTICNRTLSKVEVLAEEIDCNTLSWSDLEAGIDNYDIIISAADTRELRDKNIAVSVDKIIIDLSAPSFFDRLIMKKRNAKYFDIECAADIVNESKSERASSIPQAETIILKHMHEFLEWSKIYQQSDSIKSWKDHLSYVEEKCPFMKSLDEREKKKQINQSLKDYVSFLKNNVSHKADHRLLQRFIDESNCSFDTPTVKKACSQCPFH